MIWRRKWTIGALALITTMAAAGVISSTLAWFNDYATLPDERITGSIRGAYFAYGDGSEEEPYGITIPRHLYNLAWLQNSGYFNRDLDKNGVLDTFYFEISPNIGGGVLDMDGYYLPPIGTTTYPFLGSFNGNNNTITNLNVTNKYSDFGTNHPTTVNSSSYASTKPQIVGFFGVVGKLENQSITYDTEANVVKNVALKGFTISSETSSTLVGIAAGYVNGTLEKVAVDDGKINVVANATALSSLGADKISHYSLIGYGTDNALAKSSFRKDTASLPSAVNPNTRSGGTEWGGSIAMNTLYSQLADIRDSSSPFSGPPSVEFYIDGELDENLSAGQQTIEYTSGNEYIRYEGKTLREGELDYASFTFARSANNGSYSPYNDDESQGTAASAHYYACLDGVRTKSYTVSQRRLTNLASASSGSTFIIGDGNGNYLRRSGGTVTNTTDGSQATVWTWNAYGYLVDGNYRLRRNNTTLDATTSSTTVWNVNLSNGTITTGNTYYLVYSGAAWGVSNSAPATYYLIRDTQGHYLSRDSQRPKSTGRETATRWYDSGTYYYTDRTTVKLTYYNSNYPIYIGNYSQAYYRYDSTNHVLTALYNNTRYYVTYTGFDYYWANTTNLANATQIVVETVSPRLHLYSTYSSGNVSHTITSNPTFFPLQMDPAESYKPKNGWKENPDDEKEKPTFNTGYLISGNNLRNSSSADEYQKYFGDIRISGYPYASGNDSLSRYTLNHEIHTRSISLNAEGEPVDSQWDAINTGSYSSTTKTFDPVGVYGLKKFKKSFDAFYQTLNESWNGRHLYGLHFMDCAISINNLVTIGKATVLDKTAGEGEADAASIYENYQAPQDCIDFYLKSNGFVNFYAGTYFNNKKETNDSFFSLHQIFRNDYVEPNPSTGTAGSSTISSIKQIKKVYSPINSSGKPVAADDENPYVYLYSDGSYSDGQTHPNGNGLGPMLFNCSWIEFPGSNDSRDSNGLHSFSLNDLYYFEVPVNKGEYALGSVSGGTGAYLLYLDIGAGAANYKDVTIVETINSVFADVHFPKGVDFADLTDANTIATKIAAITGGKSSCVSLSPSTVAVGMEYAYTSTTTSGITSSVLQMTNPGNDPPPISVLALTAQGEYNTAQYASSELTLSTSYTINLERTTKIEFNPSAGTGTETVTVNEVYVIDSSLSSLSIQLPTRSAATRSWSVDSGPATVSDGLVELSASGTATILSGWEKTTEVGENWDPLLTNNETGDIEGPIFVFHFVDYTSEDGNPPNVKVTTEYSGVVSNDGNSCTYYYDITVDNLSGQSLTFVMDSIQTSFDEIENSTYVIRLHYGDVTTTISGSGSYVIPDATPASS